MDSHLGVEIQGKLFCRAPEAKLKEIKLQDPAGLPENLSGFRKGCQSSTIPTD
jgi:hypothetical protein